MNGQFIWGDLGIKGAVSAQVIKLRVLADGAISSGQFVELSTLSTSTEFHVSTANDANDFTKIIGFAELDITDGEWGEITIKGTITFNQQNNITIAQGDKLYYDWASGSQQIGNIPNGSKDVLSIGVSNTTLVSANGNVNILLDLTSNNIFVQPFRTGVKLSADKTGISYGLDINSLLTEALDSVDTLAFYNNSGSDHRKITITDFITYLNSNLTIASTLVDLTDVTGPITSNSIMVGNGAGDNMGFVQGGANQVLMTNGSNVPTFTSLSTAVDLGAASPSDIIISSQAAIKTYVDNIFSTQQIRKAGVTALVEKISTTSPASTATSQPEGVISIHKNGAQYDMYVSDGSNYGASSVGDLATETNKRIILINATGSDGVTFDTTEDNAIYEYVGADTFNNKATASEGMVTYVDIADSGNTSGEGKDALFVDDGTPHWELRNIAVSDHRNLTNLTGTGTETNTIVNMHQIRNTKSGITATPADFTVPNYCTVSYYVVGGSGGTRVGSLQINGTEMSETSTNDVGGSTSDLNFSISVAGTLVATNLNAGAATVTITITPLV